MSAHKDKKQSGTLYVVATPIGNLEDITLRAIRILGEADLIASEDTRHTRKLLSHLKISTPQISYHKERETTRADKIIEKLLTGNDVALVSDAGTPCISDPGHILVNKSRKHGIRIVPVPGPSALAAALSIAGFAENAFTFLGFLPSRPLERRKMLASHRLDQKNIVFYESPRRLSACLQDCLHVFGDRNAFWARELTKIHEESLSSSLAQLVEMISDRRIKGESVIMIQGFEKNEAAPTEDLGELLAWYKERSGLSLKDVVQQVSKDLGLSKTKVYRTALKVWRQKEKAHKS